MVKSIIFRISRSTFNSLLASFRQQTDNPADERFGFMLCSRSEGAHAIIYSTVCGLFPDKKDMARQSAAAVSPRQEFLATAYGLAADLKLSIYDQHTHPFQSRAKFSGIDDRESLRNARFLQQHLPLPSTMGMIVFTPGLDHFDGRVWNRNSQRFEDISQIEVLGSEITIIHRVPKSRDERDEKFARHLLIPGWSQQKIGDLKVFVVGLGGNGSAIFAGLLAMGVGQGEGLLAACDGDVIEHSNLARIPYATARDTGKSKATVAYRFGKRKEPKANIVCLPCVFQDPQVQNLAKEAHVIIGAVDRDSVRKDINVFAIRHLIPYIDTAAEIIPGDKEIEAGAQVRVIEPGVSSCLICGGGIDLSAGDLSALSSEERKICHNLGYVRGLDETPTPSVIHLNGIAANLAISQLQRLVFGEPLAGTDYLYYDRQHYQLVAAALPPWNEGCPVCGIHGVLGLGDHELPNENETTADDDPIRLVDGPPIKTKSVEPLCKQTDPAGFKPVEVEEDSNAITS